MNVLEYEQTCCQLCHANIFSFAQLLFHFWHISLAKHFKFGKKIISRLPEIKTFSAVLKLDDCIEMNPNGSVVSPHFKGKWKTQRAKPPRVQNVDKEDSFIYNGEWRQITRQYCLTPALLITSQNFYGGRGNYFGSWSLSLSKTWKSIGREEKRNPSSHAAACQPYLEYLAQIADLLCCNCPVSKAVQPQHPPPHPPRPMSTWNTLLEEWR